MIWAIGILVLVQVFRPTRRLFWRFYPGTVPGAIGLCCGAYAGDWFVAHSTDPFWPFILPPPLLFGLIGAFTVGMAGMSMFGFLLGVGDRPPDRKRGRP